MNQTWLHYLGIYKGFDQSWITHTIDLCIVFVIIYEILKLVRDTRAVQMAAGIAVVAALYQLSHFLHLDTLQFLMRNTLVWAGVGIIILFQAEIRTALTHFGKNLRNIFNLRNNRVKKTIDSFDEIILAVITFSAQKVGALIVLERSVGLQNYINRGVRMDAVLSYDLLVNIFNTNAPLHDGAIIIRNRKIAAASCFLPLTLNPRLSKELGTRHRAAIGISEESDAFVIIVSEETGGISCVDHGHITRNLDSQKLRLMISQTLDLSVIPVVPHRHHRYNSASELSISPDNSIQDNSSESLAPVNFSSKNKSSTSTKRLPEAGSLNFSMFIPLNFSERIINIFQKYIIKNLKLKIIAGILTLALWFSVHNQDIITINVPGIQISYTEINPNLVISNLESNQEITLRIRGSRDIVELLRPESFIVNVPLDGKGPGNRVIRLQTDAIIKNSAVAPVEILEVIPQRMTLNLERLVQHQVNIIPTFKGDPPLDYKIENYTIFPSVATLRGPESQVYGLQNVGTETIWLNTHPVPFKEKHRIDIKDSQIEILNPEEQEVEISVNIIPVIITRRFEKLKVFTFSSLRPMSPQTVDIEIQGPKSIVEKVNSSDITLTTTSLTNKNISQKYITVKFTSEFQDKVKIKSVSSPWILQ